MCLPLSYNFTAAFAAGFSFVKSRSLRGTLGRPGAAPYNLLPNP